MLHARRAAVLALAGLSLPLVTHQPAGAAPAPAPPPAETHCTVEVVGRAADGRLLTGPPRCFDGFDEVARTLGADTSDRSEAALTSQVAALSMTIGVHFDGFGFTGSSLTVTGTNCGGGHLNLSLAWRNRISSTANGCDPVRFYDGLNLTGGSEATPMPGTNLTTLNNRAESIRYGT